MGRRWRCGAGCVGCGCGKIRCRKIVSDFEDQELRCSIDERLVGHDGGQSCEVEAGSVVIFTDPEGVRESILKGARGGQVQAWSAGVGRLEDDGEAGCSAAVGVDDRAACNRCVGWQSEGERRAVSTHGWGDEIPEFHGFVVIGAGPAACYLSRVGCCLCWLVALEEDVAGEEVVLGAPGLKSFGGECGVVGGVELPLAPQDQRQFDEGGRKLRRLRVDGFESMPGLLKLLRSLLFERRARHEESEGGPVQGGIGRDCFLPFHSGDVILAGTPGEKSELFMGAGEAGVGCFRCFKQRRAGSIIVGTDIEGAEIVVCLRGSKDPGGK